MSYQAAIISTSPDGYWPLDDSSGTVAAATAGSAGVYGNSGGGTTGQRTITYLLAVLHHPAAETASHLAAGSGVAQTNPQWRQSVLPNYQRR